MNPRADIEVAVVGAGVMGLATARALAQAGRDVVVCEQFAVGNDRGSSHGGSRIVRFTYPEERWARLAQESYPGWRALEAELGRPLLELHGTLDLGAWEPNRAALAACGVPFEVLDAAEIDRRFGVTAAAVEGGLFQADGGIVHADRALRALLESAQASGARLREGVRVDSLDSDGDTVLVDGLRARCAVVTAGAWAPGLVDLDATPTRETTSYFALEGPVPSVLEASHEGQRYALLAPGVGLKAGLHQTGPVTDPNEPGAPDATIAERTADWVRARFPAAGELLRTETCLYTTRPGDEFLLERRGRIVVGSPCSGHGFKFAPVIGARLAALAGETL